MFVFLNRTIDLKEIYCYKTNTIFFFLNKEIIEDLSVYIIYIYSHKFLIYQCHYYIDRAIRKYQSIKAGRAFELVSETKLKRKYIFVAYLITSITRCNVDYLRAYGYTYYITYLALVS